MGGLSGLAQVQTCHVGSRPTPGGSPAFSGESRRKERRGQCPLDPRFYGPLAVARSFWRSCRMVPVVGLLRHPCLCPDLETFFRKNAFQHIFLENASQIGLGIPDEIAPLSYQRQRSPKRANGRERAMNPGVQGRSPGPLSPHFSGEMGTPAGQAGPPGRCASRWLPRYPLEGYRPGPRPYPAGAQPPTQRGANHKRTAGNPAVLSLSMGLSEAALTPPPGGSPLRRCREPPWCRRGPGWRRRPGPGPGPPPRWPPQRPPGRPRCR